MAIEQGNVVVGAGEAVFEAPRRNLFVLRERRFFSAMAIALLITVFVSFSRTQAMCSASRP